VIAGRGGAHLIWAISGICHQEEEVIKELSRKSSTLCQVIKYAKDKSHATMRLDGTYPDIYRKVQLPWRLLPRGNSLVNLPQMPPDSGGIYMGVD